MLTIRLIFITVNDIDIDVLLYLFIEIKYK